jgi:hypothetical protein
MDISRGTIGDMIREQSGDFIEFCKVAGGVFIPIVMLFFDKTGSLSSYRLSVLMNNYPRGIKI